MARKLSERERLLAYSYIATREELEDAKEIFATALRTRFVSKGTKRAKVKPIATSNERVVNDPFTRDASASG
jgi:hypothetical protein